MRDMAMINPPSTRLSRREREKASPKARDSSRLKRPDPMQQGGTRTRKKQVSIARRGLIRDRHKT
jgi:hypothetical protein